ncbi:flagella biosynthesis chaperone for FliD, FliT [Shewanella algae]
MMQKTEELEQINELLRRALDCLLTIPAEDERTDELVSNLQELVDRRQTLLQTLIAQVQDPNVLKEQLELTAVFEQHAKTIRQQRQDLLALRSQNKRQVNVYKTIDANR